MVAARKHREADGLLDGLLRLDRQAEDERAVNHHAGFVACPSPIGWERVAGGRVRALRISSYTFRPRRRAKRLRDKREQYHHSLKALAIRERKIHIVGSPELKIEGTPVYLDVEGLPDRDFYYLIGVRIDLGDTAVRSLVRIRVHFAGTAEVPGKAGKTLADSEASN